MSIFFAETDQRSGRYQQLALLDDWHGQRAVPDRLEKHHHAVALIRHDRALTPLGVHHTAVDRERAWLSVSVHGGR